MSENWWPTVALVHDEGGTTRVAVHGAHNPRMKHNWHYDERGIGRILAHPRHLALIDPEDREQVERLWDLFRDTADDDARDGMQAALREFANPTPPKPEEPTGLYARIKDGKGGTWVRTAEQASVWRRESQNLSGQRYLIPQDGCENYANIDVAEVLSEGVS